MTQPDSNASFTYLFFVLCQFNPKYISFDKMWYQKNHDSSKDFLSFKQQLWPKGQVKSHVAQHLGIGGGWGGGSSRKAINIHK